MPELTKHEVYKFIEVNTYLITSNVTLPTYRFIGSNLFVSSFTPNFEKVEIERIN